MCLVFHNRNFTANSGIKVVFLTKFLPLEYHWIRLLPTLPDIPDERSRQPAADPACPARFEAV